MMTDRHQARRRYEPGRPARQQAKPKKHRITKIVATLVVMSALIFGAHTVLAKNTTHTATPTKQVVATTTTPTSTTKTTVKPTTKPAPAAAPDPCAGNTLSQLALVSISQRHMWACQYTTVLYSSPVVTGMDYLAADLTPPGTYHIYDKETDIHLIGSDSTGSWNDFVYYWMGWLSNQYGQYGFHDATWRNPDEFGNISPSSANASHGCVELPLATAKWLYNWVEVGTTVKIES